MRPLLALLLSLLLCNTGLLAETKPNASNLSAQDIAQMSLLDLYELKVFSASKRTQSLQTVASAVYVITQKEIKMSGATSIPQVLRRAPGVNVAQVDGNTWAVSIRGSNAAFSNKLLVLVDGRSIYTPIFAGVNWDSLDLMLEDIDRIEIIRGPGAAVWGVNAVNGVINILTKKTTQTMGGLITGGFGTEERAFGALRYGDSLGDDSNYRIYAKYNDRDGTVNGSGQDTNDHYQIGSGGFRADLGLTKKDSLMLSGQAYIGESGQEVREVILTPPYSRNQDINLELSGGHLLANWEREIDEDSLISLLTYYDRAKKDKEDTDAGPVDRTIDTYDIELRYQVNAYDIHNLVVGTNYRHYQTDITDSTQAFYSPSKRNINLVNAFFNDEIRLHDDQVHLTIGAKIEDHEYANVELQPSARLLWTPTKKTALWGAISRAARVPSVTERDLRFISSAFPTSAGITGVSIVEGNPNINSEGLIAYELGYRHSLRQDFSFDLATFYYDYNDMIGISTNPPRISDTTPPLLEIPIQFENVGSRQSYGAELAIEWQALQTVTLTASYSYIQSHADLRQDLGQTSLVPVIGNDAQNQAFADARIQIGTDLEFSPILRYVDHLRNGLVSSYIELDLIARWQANQNLELSVVAQNLLNSHHQEFLRQGINAEAHEIERGVYGAVTWTF